MKHIAIKTAPMRLIATLLLILGTISAHAQYYINIRQTDGTRLRYAVSAVDSVWFDKDEQQEPSGNYEYVDLGLSVNWATFNVGATAPEEYGDYFAWGETEISSNYFWDTYKYCNGSDNTLTKYCNKRSYGYNGFTDSLTTLLPEDDVAHVKWGGSWRMPTVDEFTELLNSCTWTWTTLNGVKGYLVTSNMPGYTGRSIFLPGAGYYSLTSLNNVIPRGYYWSSSLYTYPGIARSLYFSSDNLHTDDGNRYFGRSVRPVCPSSTNVPSVIDSIMLSNNELSLTEGEVITISATPLDENGNEMTADVSWRSSDTTVARVDNGKITAISAGTCTITAYVDKVQSACSITVSSAAVYEYVDLGLSVNWATFNVGATAPEEYGDYFAWGETEPYYEAGYAQESPLAHWKDGKTAGYKWSNYKYCNGSSSKMTMYCNKSSYGNNGFIDSLTTLLPEDDVVNVKWGGDWRMPTLAEFKELHTNCDWEWITQNGVNGWKVTSRKDQSQSIFLPAAGYRDGTYLSYVGSRGYYWFSSLYTDTPNNAWDLVFARDGRNTYYGSRFCGQSVRPVCPSSTNVSSVIDSIVLSNNELSLTEGEVITISATLLSENGDEMTADVSWRSSDTTVARVDNGKITAISAGTCIITAYVDKVQSACSITVSSAAVYEYVDLGLSVKWATCNVGATKPEEYGDYYAWGETEPKTNYSYSSYKWCNGSYYTLTKYCKNSSYGNNGFTDTKTTLDPDDDVAHVKWGGNWRMPTIDEFTELLNIYNCTWTWTTLNGVNGYRVTSKKSGYTDRSIFLPAAGYRSVTSLDYAGEYGYYWSSSLDTGYPYNARSLLFLSGGRDTGYYSRDLGQSVRPVCP